GVGSVAMARITRSSSAGSIRTGCRRCRAIRSTASSGWSNTLCLFQYRPQLLARPLDTHLECGNPGAGESCHVLVLEILDVLEQRVPAEAIAIPRDEIGVGPGVAGLHTTHQGGVARPHFPYTPSSADRVTLSPIPPTL